LAIPTAVIHGADIQNLATRSRDAQSSTVSTLDEHTLNAVLAAASTSNVDLSISTVYVYENGVIAFLTPLDQIASHYDELVDEYLDSSSTIDPFNAPPAGVTPRNRVSGNQLSFSWNSTVTGQRYSTYFINNFWNYNLVVNNSRNATLGGSVSRVGGGLFNSNTTVHTFSVSANSRLTVNNIGAQPGHNVFIRVSTPSNFSSTLTGTVDHS